ncbi:MAG: fructose-bisphosphate aldolase [bacterium]|nr:fructose-bisphosphate aldolase [bacterium]
MEVIKRLNLNEIPMSTGKKVRLHRLLYEHGTGKGTCLFLPVDQGLEHGPIDFLENPESIDPLFELKLAVEGRYSGIVLHIGLAEKYLRDFAGEIPLVLKLNGKTAILPDDEAFSPLVASVEDAVRLGGDAIGYTLYVGSPSQDKDFQQLFQVRREAEKLGMPLIVWSYPRGRYVETMGGRDSLYAVDYAARVAHELGADIIKLNVPKSDPEAEKLSPAPYNTIRMETLSAIKKVVKSAGRSFVIFAGGGKISDTDLANKARICMEGGATGLIFGRNIWQRKFFEALRITGEIKEMMKEFSNL